MSKRCDFEEKRTDSKSGRNSVSLSEETYNTLMIEDSDDGLLQIEKLKGFEEFSPSLPFRVYFKSNTTPNDCCAVISNEIEDNHYKEGEENVQIGICMNCLKKSKKKNENLISPKTPKGYFLPYDRRKFVTSFSENRKLVEKGVIIDHPLEEIDNVAKVVNAWNIRSPLSSPQRSPRSPRSPNHRNLFGKEDSKFVERTGKLDEGKRFGEIKIGTEVNKRDVSIRKQEKNYEWMRNFEMQTKKLKNSQPKETEFHVTKSANCKTINSSRNLKYWSKKQGNKNEKISNAVSGNNNKLNMLDEKNIKGSKLSSANASSNTMKDKIFSSLVFGENSNELESIDQLLNRFSVESENKGKKTQENSRKKDPKYSLKNLKAKYLHKHRLLKTKPLHNYPEIKKDDSLIYFSSFSKIQKKSTSIDLQSNHNNSSEDPLTLEKILKVQKMFK